MFVLVNWIANNDYEIMDVSKEPPPKKTNYFKTFLKVAPYLFNFIPAFQICKNYLFK